MKIFRLDSLNPMSEKAVLTAKMLVNGMGSRYFERFGLHPKFGYRNACYLNPHPFHPFEFNSLSYLMETIPVFLVGSGNQREYVFQNSNGQLFPGDIYTILIPQDWDIEKGKVQPYIEEKIERPFEEKLREKTSEERWEHEKCSVMDLLGCYVTYSETTKSPAIFIWIDKIKECAEQFQTKTQLNKSEKFDALATQVLLHEFMHAIMDVGNQKKIKSVEATWKEESLANAMTLHLFDRNPLYAFTKEFMLSQPDAYKLAALWDIKYDGWIWYTAGLAWVRYKADTFCKQIVLEKWYEYVSQNMNSSNFDIKYLYSLDELFDEDVCYMLGNRLYNEQDIVLEVLNKYVQDHSGINYADFQKVYSTSLNSQTKMYLIWPKGKNFEDSRDKFYNIYPNVRTNFYYCEEKGLISLQDEDIMLSDMWNVKADVQNVITASGYAVTVY